MYRVQHPLPKTLVRVLLCPKYPLKYYPRRRHNSNLSLKKGLYPTRQVEVRFLTLVFVHGIKYPSPGDNLIEKGSGGSFRPSPLLQGTRPTSFPSKHVSIPSYGRV